MDCYKILFTGVGRRVELIQAFRNAVLILNEDLKIYGADITSTAPALAYCDIVKLVPGMKEPGYIPALVKICRQNQIDLLIPVIDTDLLVLSENTRQFEETGTRVLISSPDKIRVCRDKSLTSQFFIDCGLKAPLTVDCLEAYQSGFPAFIKPRDGSSSVNAFRVNDEQELALLAHNIGDYIIQPFIDGTEYTIDIFCDFHGNPLSIVPRERIAVRAGEVLKTRIQMDKIMIAEARKLCETFRPCGPLTVQLIRESKTGTDWYIEINPRFGGGAPLSIKAGARTPEMLLRLLSHRNGIPSFSISDHAVYSRFDQSVCVKTDCSHIRGIIFDLDDTLYSEKDYVKSGFHVVSEYLGGGYETELWTFFEEGKPAIDELLRNLRREKQKNEIVSVYRSHNPSIHLYDDVIRTLTDLRSKGIRLGIITDGRPEGQKNKIQALGLTDMVDDIIITDELGGEQFRKPNDIAFRIMQNRWRLPMEEIAYVGDNITKDFQAPRQLGMKSIYFKNPDGLYSSDLPGQINSFSELLTMV